MDIFLSAVSCLQKYFDDGLLDPSKCKVLSSFYGISDFERRMIHKYKKFMLDSGAFSFLYNKKMRQNNWDDYLTEYAEFIKDNDIDLFFELDIDTIVGYEKVKEMREKLETLTGKKCIPVWHPGRGVEEYRKHVKEYSYVAIGSFKVHGLSKQVQEKCYRELIKIAHDGGAKVHGLGYTSIPGMARYNFDSVDSTTWLSGGKYGNLVEISYDNGGLRAIQKHCKERLENCTEISYINFKTFVKFSEFAEINL